jgi:hypothetical protein
VTAYYRLSLLSTSTYYLSSLYLITSSNLSALPAALHKAMVKRTTNTNKINRQIKAITTFQKLIPVIYLSIKALPLFT